MAFVESFTLPAVSMNFIGFPFPFVTVWIFDVSPPRLLPILLSVSVGFAPTFLRNLNFFLPLRCVGVLSHTSRQAVFRPSLRSSATLSRIFVRLFRPLSISENLLYAVCHGPYFSGSSHHGDPVRATQFIAFISSRGSRLGCPLRDVFPSISSFTAFHWWSLNSYLLIVLTLSFLASIMILLK